MSLDADAIASDLNRLCYSVSYEPDSIPCEVISLTLKDRDVFAKSEEEMLLAKKEKGSLILRTDTQRLNYFHGGDYYDLNNYSLITNEWEVISLQCRE